MLQLRRAGTGLLAIVDVKRLAGKMAVSQQAAIGRVAAQWEHQFQGDEL